MIDSACTVTYMTERSVELSVADSRREYADVLNAAATRGRITYITSRGRRVAAIVPVLIAEQNDPSSAPKEG